MTLRKRTGGVVNDQLLCGVALAAAGVAALVAGVQWLALAALVASVPFLAVGVVLGVSARGVRARTTH